MRMAKNRPVQTALFSMRMRRQAITLALLTLSALSYAQATSTNTEQSAESSNATDTTNENLNADPAPPTAQRAPTKERLQKEAKQLLSDIEPPPSPVWIPVEGEQILGFWQEDLSGNPVGALLMLHADGHSARWPATLLNLHQQLPIHGWSTLSISLPSPAPSEIPERSQPAQTAPEVNQKPDDSELTQESAESSPAEGAAPVDETQVVYEDVPDTAGTDEVADTPREQAPTPEEIERKARVTIQAALDYLQQQNQFNIALLGEGLGGARALEFIGQAKIDAPPAQTNNGISKRAVVDRPIRALVLLDVNLSGNKTLPDLLLYPEVPTLDLISSVQFDARNRLQKRKQVSRKKQYKVYSARRILPQTQIPDAQTETDITKTIRGFLTQRAEGVEL